MIFPSVLIVYGAHCRSENIDENRCWKEDEDFYVCGELIKRKKGEKVPGALMRSWWECKMKYPELLEDIHVTAAIGEPR